MIYVDTSVILAQLLAEDRVPRPALWAEALVSSRLLEYELWTRLHARRLGSAHGDAARDLLARIAFVEMVSPVLDRALEPFPTVVRTLDALHLASLEFLRARGEAIQLATFDTGLIDAARALGIPVYET